MNQVQTAARRLSNLLQANVGRTVKVSIEGGPELLQKQATGKLISVDGDVVLVQTDTGTLARRRASLTPTRFM